MYKTNMKDFPLHGDIVLLSESVCPPSSIVPHRLLVPLGRWAVSDLIASCNFFLYLPFFSRPLECMQGYQKWTRIISKSYPNIQIMDILTEEGEKTPQRWCVSPLVFPWHGDPARCQGTQGKQNISIKVSYFTRLTASCQWIMPWLGKKCLQRFIKTTPDQTWRESEGNGHRGHPAGITQFTRKLRALTQLYGSFLGGKIVAYSKSRQPGT